MYILYIFMFGFFERKGIKTWPRHELGFVSIINELSYFLLIKLVTKALNSFFIYITL